MKGCYYSWLTINYKRFIYKSLLESGIELFFNSLEVKNNMENENKFQGLYNQGLEETYTINQVEEALEESDVSMNRDGKYFDISGDTPQIMGESSIVDLVRDYHENNDANPVEVENEYSRVDYLTDNLSKLNTEYSLGIEDNVEGFAVHLNDALTLANYAGFNHTEQSLIKDLETVAKSDAYLKLGEFIDSRTAFRIYTRLSPEGASKYVGDFDKTANELGQLSIDEEELSESQDKNLEDYDTVEDLSNLRKSGLLELCDMYDLIKSGTKTDIAERLMTYKSSEDYDPSLGNVISDNLAELKLKKESLRARFDDHATMSGEAYDHLLDLVKDDTEKREHKGLMGKIYSGIAGAVVAGALAFGLHSGCDPVPNQYTVTQEQLDTTQQTVLDQRSEIRTLTESNTELTESNTDLTTRNGELNTRLAGLDWGNQFLAADSNSAREAVLDNFVNHYGGEVRGKNLENFYELLTANSSSDFNADNNNNGSVDKDEIQTNLRELGMTDTLSGWNSSE